MANWPSPLPVPLVEGAAYASQDNAIRSEVAAGVAKVRRRYTAVPDDFTGKLWLTGAEWSTLLTFVVTTCADVLPFTWEASRRPDGMPAGRACRFRSRPKRVPLGNDWWEVQLELEVLP